MGPCSSSLCSSLWCSGEVHRSTHGNLWTTQRFAVLHSGKRQLKDHDIFVQWLQAHLPFVGYQPDRLMSIASGVVADVSGNCNDAVNVGLAAAAKITGKHFTDITLMTKSRQWVTNKIASISGGKTQLWICIFSSIGSHVSWSPALTWRSFYIMNLPLSLHLCSAMV